MPPGSARRELRSSELRFPDRWIPPGKAKREFKSSEFLFPDLWMPPGNANNEFRSSEFRFPDLWIFTGIANKELRSSEFLFSIPSTSSVNAASLSSCSSKLSDGAALTVNAVEAITTNNRYFIMRYRFKQILMNVFFLRVF